MTLRKLPDADYGLCICGAQAYGDDKEGYHCDYPACKHWRANNDRDKKAGKPLEELLVNAVLACREETYSASVNDGQDLALRNAATAIRDTLSRKYPTLRPSAK